MRQVELECIDGKSSKFWHAKQSGNALDVVFGRIGTAGQDKHYYFEDRAEAAASLEKQVKEKLKKGYVSKLDRLEKDDEEAVDAAPVKSAPASAAKPAKAKSAAAKSEEIPRPAVASAAIVRRMDLNPIEKGYAFHRRVLLPKPPIASFDRDEWVKKLSCERQEGEIMTERLRATKTSRAWSLEECQFWVYGVTSYCEARHEYWRSKMGRERIFDLYGYLAENMTAAMSEVDFSVKPTVDQFVKIFDAVSLHVITIFNGGIHNQTQASVKDTLEHLIYPLFNIFSVPEIIEIWERIWISFEHATFRSNWADYLNSNLITAVRTEAVPFIHGEELAELQAYLKRRMDVLDWHPASSDEQVPLPYIMAGLFGMHDCLLPLIQSIPDDFYGSEEGFHHLNRPQLLLLGLNNRDTLVREWRRLGMPISKSGECLAWLAHTDWHELDNAMRYVNSHINPKVKTRDDLAEFFFQFIKKVVAPEAVRHVFALSQNRSFTKMANKWMSDNKLITFAGLAELQKEPTPLAAAALSHLRDMIKNLDRDSLPVEYHRQFDDIVERVNNARIALGDKARPKWLEEAFDKKAPTRKGALPNWLDDVALAPVVINGYVLEDKEVNQIVQAIKASRSADVHPLLRVLRDKTERSSFDAFTWELYERWYHNLAPSKDKWCLLAVGYLASDQCLFRLIPLMKEWRGGGNPGRAAFVLDALEASGTNLALLKLHEISQTSSLKSLKPKAKEKMQAVAAARGLKPSQLEERIVPTCGFDESGNKIFDFGQRQFRFVLGPNLKPCVKDESGKVKGDLPAPGKGDDEVKAAQALKDWKATKLEIKSVVKMQAKRLELALVSGRRWSVEDFTALIAGHPFVKVFCRPLIWGVFDKANKLTHSFRMTEENELADENEKLFKLSPLDGEEHSIGLLHPMLTDEKLLAKWGDILSDYNLIPPFAQLGRPIFKLTAEEAKAGRISRFDGLKVEAVVIPGTLDRRDWAREEVMDGGIFCGHYKYFEGCDVTAFVTYPGIIPGMLTESDDQEFSQIGFMLGDSALCGFGQGDGEDRSLKAVDPVIISEVLADLTAVMDKAKKA